MRLWPRYPAGHPVTDGRRLEVGLVAQQLWFVAKSWRRGYRYGWRSGLIYGPPIQGPHPSVDVDALEDRISASEAYAEARAVLEASLAPLSLTEERVREIVREEMARSARRVGRTPGLAGSMKR